MYFSSSITLTTYYLLTLHYSPTPLTLRGSCSLEPHITTELFLQVRYIHACHLMVDMCIVYRFLLLKFNMLTGKLTDSLKDFLSGLCYYLLRHVRYEGVVSWVTFGFVVSC